MGKTNSVVFLISAALVLLSGVYIMNGTQAYTRYQQNSIAMQEQCGGEALVHICVQAPRAFCRVLSRSYLDTDYPLFHINYSSPLTLLLNISIPIFSQMQMVDASANMRLHAFVPSILDESL